ncbi:ATP-grasp domain-containing protein [Halomicrococcus gelatinilyticus]|uniref:ATP-grasp domain-containing protein n=1 Tax=Halomicrococcus gelatinilyticus TaxID=1702103 RepID=UPI002E11B523
MTERSLRVGVVTGEDAPDLTENGRSVLSALRDRGLAAEPVVWTDDAVDWTTFDVALVRSCWGYHARIDAFRDWLDAVEDAGTTLLNPGDVVRWNVHKFYLRDLEATGVPVVPTTWVEQGSDADLAELLRDEGWREAVVKPAVGTSSVGTWRTSLADAADDQGRFAAAVADGDLLVQAFAPEVFDGERSLVFFGGEYSHAVRCVPAEGEFRSHPDYGGTVEPHDPPQALVDDAAAVLRAARSVLGVDPVDLPYARVDGIVRGGEFRLMELELVEPYLNLDVPERGPAALADAVVDALGVGAVTATDSSAGSP